MADTATIPGLPMMAHRLPGHAAAQPTSPYRRHSPSQGALPARGTSAQQAFIGAVAPAAVATQRKYGVPASVTIAQAIDESGWGQSNLAVNEHNLFGIKGTGPAGSYRQQTQEYENGQLVNATGSFRVYRTTAESVDDHGRLLATSGYYRRAMAVRGNPDAFAASLTGVYATDPDYGTKIIRLMKQYDLYRYDSIASAAGAAQSAPRPAPSASAAPGQASHAHPAARPATPAARHRPGPRRHRPGPRPARQRPRRRHHWRRSLVLKGQAHGRPALRQRPHQGRPARPRQVRASQRRARDRQRRRYPLRALDQHRPPTTLRPTHQRRERPQPGAQRRQRPHARAQRRQRRARPARHREGRRQPEQYRPRPAPSRRPRPPRRPAERHRERPGPSARHRERQAPAGQRRERGPAAVARRGQPVSRASPPRALLAQPGQRQRPRRGRGPGLTGDPAPRRARPRPPRPPRRFRPGCSPPR